MVVVEVIYAFAANDDDKNFQDFVQISGFVLGYFLPIIIIMLVTSEASQRNGLVTFTLEPKRSRVVVAKFIAGVALAAVGAGRWPSCWPSSAPLFGIVTGGVTGVVPGRQPDVQRLRAVQPDRHLHRLRHRRC